MTTNYGLLGGTLDATRHIEAAAERLLNADERHRWSQINRPEQTAVIATQPGREKAEEN